jgi:hypothetical protein
MRKKLLFISRYVLDEPCATGRTIIDLIQYCQSLSFNVTFLNLASSPSFDLEAALTCNVISAGLGTRFYDSPSTDTERDFVRDTFQRIEPSIVITDYAWTAGNFDLLPGFVEKMILVHDLRTRIVSGLESHGHSHAHHPWNKSTESFYLQKADAIIVLNEEDADECREMAQFANVLQIGLSSDLRFSGGSSVVPGRVLYVASSFGANKEAIERFVIDCWPTIRNRIPNATLHICGGVSDRVNGEIASESNGVFLRGRVDDIDTEHIEAAVCIVPIRHVGTKRKFADALAHGKAVVSTKVGIDGFPEAYEKCALIADDIGEQFADHVANVLSSDELRHSLENEARALAEKRLPPENAYRNLVEHFKMKSLLET